MRSRILALGLAMASLPALAQNSVNYNRSAFSDFRNMKPSENAKPVATQNLISQQFPSWRATADKLNGMFRDAFGPALNIPGNNLNDKAQYCFANKLQQLNVDPAEWVFSRQTTGPKNSFVRFEQQFNGRKVVFANMTFTFTTTDELVRLQMNNYGKPAAGMAPTMSAADVQAAALQDLDGVTVSEHNVGSDWVWFPVPKANGYELRPAWPYNVKGEGKNLPVDMNGYIDGVTGKILYRTNEVKETVDQTIKGNVYSQNPLLPATNEPLADLAITVGSTTYYTNDTGLFSAPSLSAPISATMALRGRWSKVTTATTSGTMPSFVNNIVTTGGTYLYPNTTPSSDKHVNAYYHVDRVHDFMKGYFPAFTGMDISLPTVVDMTTGVCNAFYNGNSINFYAESLTNGCLSFALCGDIIYHEYGHGISDKFYTAQIGNGMQNGALNEGSSDIWGISITNDPVLGKGSMTNGGIIRRYDQAPKVYPVDIQGEVHADGEIIAGAWWDVAVNIGATDTMTQLFTKTYFYTPDGPDGTEGQVYHDVLIGALMSDDNDNNLNNGTPHFTQIIKAFARHGIYLLGDAIFQHTEIPNQPASTPITINTTLTLTTPAFLQGVKIFYRNRVSGATPYDSLDMVAAPSGSLTYTVQLPGQPEGSIMDYYFAVYDNLGYQNAFAPVRFTPTAASININSNIPYQFGVGISAKYTQDFESTVDTTWKIGQSTDDATKGLWIQASPIASYLTTASGTEIVQTDADHTTGTGSGKCLITGNAPSAASAPGVEDVDNGTTTILTPVFDLSGYNQPVIEYFRWFGNDKGNNPENDPWEVQIKDASTSNWRYVDRSYKSDYSWRRRIFALKEFLAASTMVQMRFMASDKIVSGSFQNGQSTVEAAIDDMIIYEKNVINGVNNTTTLRADIYPNPANQQVTIRLAEKANGYVGIYDVTGREMFRVNMNGDKDNYILSTAALATGTYMVVVKSEYAIQTKKLTVVH